MNGKEGLMKARLNPTLALIAVILLLSSGSIRAQSGAGTAALGAAFTYQGRLTDGGSPANGAYDLRFLVYDAEVGGSQVGNVIIYKDDLTVTEGLFTVYLDFGGNVFTGSPCYLDISVRPGSSTGVYTTLSPRQLLSPTPYALYSASTGALQGQAISAGAPQAGQVLKWDGGQWLAASTDHDHYGAHWSGSAPQGLWVSTSANTDGAAGVLGQAGSGSGSNYHPYAAAGVWGDSSSGIGVAGTSASGNGVYGFSSVGNGVAGYSSAHSGVVGESASTNGVEGISHASAGAGIYASNDKGGYAGYLSGKVRVTGFLEKAGGGFVIDHPLDAANTYLYHSFVESPDMKNIYDGVATLDASGRAAIELPAWFESLNQDFRYQITCIGGFAPVYVAQEIQGNRFTIAGGKPGMKVSWQVTGIRHDPWAAQHRMQVEVSKPPQERGKYLYPAEYGQPETLGVDYARRQQTGQVAPQALETAR